MCYSVRVFKEMGACACRVESNKDPSAQRVTLPVYLNATRGQLLFTLDFDSAEKADGKDHRFYERGVAIICSDLS
ncbi:hypothetical protein V1264_018048 [Littorina saxatilis]|uniref:Uncharacterized protein n=1 Tax=Littorina saxatilis TaxID=31220 RepID=A0AAN9GCE3_9CAEN